jgi:hypothetical protein
MPKLKEEGPKTNRFVFGTINKSCILVLVVIGLRLGTGSVPEEV